MKKLLLSSFFIFLTIASGQSLIANSHYGVSLEEIDRLKKEDPVVAQHILACFDGDKKQRQNLHTKLWFVFSFVQSAIGKMVEDRPHNFKTITSMHKDGKTLEQIAQEEKLEYLLKLISEHSKSAKFAAMSQPEAPVVSTEPNTATFVPFSPKASNNYIRVTDNQKTTRLQILDFQKTLRTHGLRSTNNGGLYRHFSSKKQTTKNPAVKNHRALISEEELFLLLSFNG